MQDISVTSDKVINSLIMDQLSCHRIHKLQTFKSGLIFIA